jgi:hypothetical protein
MASSYENVTVSSSAIGLTATKYGPIQDTTLPISRTAKKALITVEGDQIRWTCDGTTPVGATTGHRANVDDVITLEGFDAIRLFRAIRITADATLRVTYFGG